MATDLSGGCEIDREMSVGKWIHMERLVDRLTGRQTDK